MELLNYILAGATVGLAIGITGVGGGSLMTPMLLAFGFPLHIAVGTDLLYAAITKTGGVVAHGRQKTVRWTLVFRLAMGSIPASAISIYALHHWFDSPEHYAGLISSSLGITLIFTSAAIIFRDKLSHLASGFNWHERTKTIWLMPIMGAVLGVLVTISSVGAGAIATALLILLYPTLSSHKVVGTDIAHAVPLTLFAGLGHVILGNVNFLLLIALLVGSLPAVYVGARFARHIPDRVLRPVLASMLLGAGIKVAFL